MSDVREQAERLVELDRRAAESRGIGDAGLTPLEWEELQIFVKPGMDTLLEFARAYLAECEAHERMRNMMINYLRGVVKTCGECRGKGFLMQMFTTTRPNPRCNKCFYERSLLASIEQREDHSK